MQIFFSSGAFQSRSLPRIVELSIEFGVDRVELSSGCAFEPDMLDSVRRTNGNPNTYLVHNYFPPPEDPFVLNLASTEPDQLHRSKELVRSAIELGAELGAPFYSVHSGFAVALTPELLGRPDAQAELPKEARVDYETAYEVFVESLKELTGFARDRDMELLIENNVVAPRSLNNASESPLLMARSDEITRLLSDVDDPALGLLVDVGHANVSATSYGFDPAEFVETLAPHIRAFHLSANDGQEDQNKPFEATEWFCPLLKDFKELVMVVEAYHLPRDAMLRQRDTLSHLLE